jgi:hypothetical protein
MEGTPDEFAEPIQFRRIVAICVVWGVWALLSIRLGAYVHANAFDVPFLDEWEMVDALTGHQPISLAWLWAQHNEHRIPLPRLVYLALAKLSGGDFRAGMYFNAAALATLAAAMILTARRMRGRTEWVDGFFPLVLLHTGHFENILSSFQVEFVLSTVLACAVLLMVVESAKPLTWTHGAIAGTSLLALPLTGAHGLPFVPPLAIWLAAWAWQSGSTSRAARRTAYGFAVASIALVVVYFIDYRSVSQHPPSGRIRITMQVAWQFLTMGFGPAIIPQWNTARFLALAVLAASLVTLAWRTARQPDERVRSLGLFGVLVAVVGLAIGIGWGRGGIDRHLGFAFRYATLAAPWLCAAYFVAAGCRSATWRRAGQWTLVALSVAFFAGNSRVAGEYAALRREKFEAFQRDVANPIDAAELARRHVFLYPQADRLAERIDRLRKAQYGGFAVQAPRQPGATPPGVLSRHRESERP